MYALAVSDHIMIAHSFKGEVFGPAQQVHGATYTVEAEFKSERLDSHGLVCDIGLALAQLKEVLAVFNYRNLDELHELAGINTTTEFMAAEIHRRLKGRIHAGALGPDAPSQLVALKVVLRESPVAWASFDGPLA
jgi:6-pyruvoyl-tetrahydropterin synthase